MTEPQSPRRILEFLVAAGVDIIVGDEPVNRLQPPPPPAMPERGPEAPAAARTAAPAQPAAPCAAPPAVAQSAPGVGNS